MAKFTVSADVEGTALIVNVAGEVDMATAPQLTAVFDEHLGGGRYRARVIRVTGVADRLGLAPQDGKQRDGAAS